MFYRKPHFIDDEAQCSDDDDHLSETQEYEDDEDDDSFVTDTCPSCGFKDCLGCSPPYNWQDCPYCGEWVDNCCCVHSEGDMEEEDDSSSSAPLPPPAECDEPLHYHHDGCPACGRLTIDLTKPDPVVIDLTKDE